MIDKIIIGLYTFVICLFPWNMKFAVISYSRIIFLLSLIIFIYNFLRNRNIMREAFKTKIIKSITLGFSIFLLFVMISTVVNSFFNNQWILSDFFELARILQYYLIFINYYVIFYKNSNNIKFFNSIILIIVLIVGIVGFCQYFNVLGLNKYYVKVIAPTQYVSLMENYPNPRIVGLVGNPNVLGFFLALFLVYLLYLILINGLKFKYIIMSLIGNVLILMTLSRTAYVCLLVGEITLVFFAYFKFKNIIKAFMYVLSIILFNVLLITIMPEKLTWRIMELINIEQIDSWQERVKSNKEYWDDYNDNIIGIGNNENKPDSNTDVSTNPCENEIIDINNNFNIANYINKVIGHGPDKLGTKHSLIFDNEWIMFLFRYGYIGLVSYIAMLLIPILYYKFLDKKNWALYIAITLMIFTYMIPAASYHCDILFAFYLVLVASCLTFKKEVRSYG